VNISLAFGQLYLIVGPEANPTAAGTTAVTFSVSTAQLGNGNPVAGTPNVHVQVGVRRLFNPSYADLTVTAPSSVDSGPNQIPISDFGWTTVQVAGAPPGTTLIPGGTLSAGTQMIYTLNPPFLGTSWAAGLFTFQYANAQIYPAGSYGPATINFTATRP
jgi:hypothetical protein